MPNGLLGENSMQRSQHLIAILQKEMATAQLFTWDGLKTAVINRDDAFGTKLAAELSAQGKSIMTYGLNEDFVGKNDIAVSGMQLTDAGIHLNVVTPSGAATIRANVIGQFNAYNLLAVLATLLASDVALVDAVKALSTIKPVTGRMQQCGGGNQPLIVVDYAHTPDAFSVNTAMQRCLAKAISLHGLGMYIYAGEDLPMVEMKDSEAKEAKTSKAIEAPKASITPTAGALEAYNTDEKDLLNRIAEEVTGLGDAGDRLYGVV